VGETFLRPPSYAYIVQIRPKLAEYRSAFPVPPKLVERAPERSGSPAPDEVVLSDKANSKIKSFRPNHTEVYKSAMRLATAMAALNIPCAIAGGMATIAHGYQRTTRDVDVVLTPEGMNQFKDWGVGRGWVDRYKGARNLRDTISDVGVDLILTTDKPLNVPLPTQTVSNVDGLPILPLPRLIELKLSSAALNEKRRKDISDVKGLIMANGLGPDFAEYLDPSVRAQFLQLLS